MLVALFRTEPTAELLQQLSNGIEERTQGARNLHPLLGQGWEEIQRFLTNTPYQSLAETVSDGCCRENRHHNRSVR